MISAAILFLKTHIGKALTGFGVLGLILFLTFQLGVSSAKGKCERKAAQEALQWAEKARVAEANGYARGLRAVESEARYLAEIERIARDAGMEAGADDESCLSDEGWARLQRLRGMQ